MACTNTLTNGAPLVLFRGTEDNSGQDVPVEAIPRPQHLPTFIVQTQRGPLGQQIVFGAQRDLLYGSASFRETGLWTNHQTIGSNICMTAANAHIIWRVSAGERANRLLSLEVTPVDLPLYERDSSGKYLTDSLTSALIPTADPPVEGHTLRWVVSTLSSDDLTAEAVSTYTQSGLTNPTTVYPIMAFRVENPGSFGNNIGFRLYADTRSGATDVAAMEANKAFPYHISLLERATQTASPKFTTTITSEQAPTVTFSPSSLLRATGAEIPSYVKTVLDTQYSNTEDTRYALRYSPFGEDTYVYQNNVNTVLAQIAAVEAQFLADNPSAVTGLNLDLLAEDGGYGLINFMSAKDHTDVPYYTIVMDETELPGSSVRLTQYTTIYCGDGLDNIMSVSDYEQAVADIIARYGDCTDEVMDIARRPESIFYDTGFTVDTKLELAPYISQRPDLNLVLSTHEDSRQVRGYNGIEAAGESRSLSLSEEVATATLLQTRTRLIPESEYFGTPTSRAVIFAGSGVLRNSEWTARVPVTMDMLYKASMYMGAADGKWNSKERFSRAPGSILTLLKDVTIPWVAAEQRVRNWDVGINMALPYNEQFMSMPSTQTVYPDDSSVLNVWLVTLAISYINKIAHAAWREYRGVDDLSSAELEVAIDNFVTARVDGIFDGRYLIIPKTEVTTDDERRGTSWHLNVQIGATTSRTVEIVQVTAYRRADLETIA